MMPEMDAVNMDDAVNLDDALNLDDVVNGCRKSRCRKYGCCQKWMP